MKTGLPFLVASVAVLGIAGYMAYSREEAPQPQAGNPASLTGTPEPEAVGPTTEYEGAWFTISYPQSFTAQSLPSGNDGAIDEATFTSPDGSVQFYVFSPLWAGDPYAYLDPLPTETIQSDETRTDIDPTAAYPQKVTRYLTYGALDGSYARSLVSIKTGIQGEPETLHLVFGIRYRDRESYERYLDEYLAFKNSLIQYAD